MRLLRSILPPEPREDWEKVLELLSDERGYIKVGPTGSPGIARSRPALPRIAPAL